jgi:hypothetical protein
MVVNVAQSIDPTYIALGAGAVTFLGWALFLSSRGDAGG